MRFQSTLPRGERRGTSCTSSILRNFNPRSHEGSDRQPPPKHRHLLRFQSTLPRGERPAPLPEPLDFGVISIHAPTRGATKISLHCHKSCEISIHAPTRGATCSYCGQEYPEEFQSTLPRGERPGTYMSCRCVILFQSTLPRGERRTF